MEDTFSNDFEDNLCDWENNDYGLSPECSDISQEDCGHDAEEVTEEELYEQIYYENDTENGDNKPSFIASQECSVSRSPISNIENDQNESVKDKVNELKLNGTKQGDKNNSNVNIGDDFSMKEIKSEQSKFKQNISSKKDTKLSCREIIKAAGLTMSDLKKFINEENNDKSISVDHSSDSEASEYLILSETEMSDECDSSRFNSDDENVQTFYTLKSLSDSLLAQILNNLPADSSWDISDSDAIGRPKATSRFYNSLMRVRCHNCSNRGHHRKDCPEPQKQLKCILCGDAGHTFRACPDQICFRCERPGHTMKECDEKVASKRTQCARCHSRGHFEERCPDVWRQYHLTVTAGEIIKKNVKDKKEVGKNGRWLTCCYNCGEDGHLGHKCGKQRMDAHQIVHCPFVFKYDVINSVSDTENYKPVKNERNTGFNLSRNYCLSTSAPLRLSHSFKDDHYQYTSCENNEDTDISLNSFDYPIPKYNSTPNSNITLRDRIFGSKNASERMLQSPYTNATGKEKNSILPLMNISDGKEYDNLYKFKVPQVPKKIKNERWIQRGGSLKNVSMPDASVDRSQHEFHFFQNKKFKSFESFPTEKNYFLDGKEAVDSKMSRRERKIADFWKRRKMLEEEKGRRKMLIREENFMQEVLKDYNDGRVRNGQSREDYHDKKLFEKRKLLKPKKNAKKTNLKTTDNTGKNLKKPSIPNMGDKSYGFDTYSEVIKITKTRKRANKRKNALNKSQNLQSNDDTALYENWYDSIVPSYNSRNVDFSYENFTVTFK